MTTTTKSCRLTVARQSNRQPSRRLFVSRAGARPVCMSDRQLSGWSRICLHHALAGRLECRSTVKSAAGSQTAFLRFDFDRAHIGFFLVLASLPSPSHATPFKSIAGKASLVSPMCCTMRSMYVKLRASGVHRGSAKICWTASSEITVPTGELRDSCAVRFPADRFAPAGQLA